jgi:hypothetical protein
VPCRGRRPARAAHVLAVADKSGSGCGRIVIESRLDSRSRRAVGRRAGPGRRADRFDQRQVDAVDHVGDGCGIGAFQILGYRSPAAARTAILRRSVYGAFDPGPPPSLLIADAASLPVATLLQETFTAAARAQGAPLIVHDLVPLPPTDPTGGTAFSATLSLIIAGVLGSSLLYLVTQGRDLAVHLSAVLALGIGAGLLTAIATNIVVGAFTSQFLAIWGVAALFVLALALPIAFFQRLLGLPGTGVGLLVFIVVGDPSSGGATAPQLLPDPWRAISQALPPGAATTAMRDVVYFHCRTIRDRGHPLL